MTGKCLECDGNIVSAEECTGEQTQKWGKIYKHFGPIAIERTKKRICLTVKQTKVSDCTGSKSQVRDYHERPIVVEFLGPLNRGITKIYLTKFKNS